MEANKKPKRKKVVVRQQPKQKSAFKLKTKKSKPKAPSKALLRSKLSSAPKSKLRLQHKNAVYSLSPRASHYQPLMSLPSGSQSPVPVAPVAKTPERWKAKPRRSASHLAQGREASDPDSWWDASTQAAIRVGDWKLLTGYPGHGDWVPPQVGPGHSPVPPRQLAS